MEVISSHELKDIIRVEAGILIEIHKYVYKNGWIWTTDYKNYLKKLSGVKNGYIVKQEFIHRETEYKKGDYILEHCKVAPITDKDLFRVELKCAGGSIRKSFKEMNELMECITNYINTNYE